jgi:hypothetical protein
VHKIRLPIENYPWDASRAARSCPFGHVQAAAWEVSRGVQAVTDLQNTLNVVGGTKLLNHVERKWKGYAR